MKAQKGINTKNNQPIISVTGNTYPYRQQLGRKGLGFTWWGGGKMWYMPASRFNDNVLNSLINLGVDVSALTSNKATETPPEAPGTPQTKTTPQTSDIREKPSESDLTDKTTGEYNYTKYPINPNIYSEQINVNIDGKNYPLTITFGRIDKINYGDSKKTMPILTYQITLTDDPENIILKNSFRPKDANNKAGRWNKRYGPNYDEDNIVRTYIDAIKNEKTRIYNKIKIMIRDKEALGRRDPNFVNFLNKWGKWKYDKEHKSELRDLIDKNIPPRNITINEPGYEGAYPISFELISFTIYPHTALQHPLAPRSENFNSAAILIDSDIQNIEQLNQLIDKTLAANKEKIKEKYLNYLKSFAFSKKEEQETRQQMEEIAEIIQNKSTDVDMVKRELMQRQFIRPSRKFKNLGPGMVPEGGFKLIIDDKAIRNATFSKDNSPEYFWVAIAYNLMRIKHNNIGFMPIFLDDAYRRVASTVKRYGYDISARDVADYINKAARALYNDLTGRTYKSWDERWTNFYSGDWRKTNTAIPSHIPPASVVDDWLSFAAKYDIDVETAKNNAKQIYRQLAIKLHPDNYGPEGTELFKELDRLYKQLPDTMKIAINWYQKIKTSDL